MRVHLDFKCEEKNKKMRRESEKENDLDEEGIRQGEGGKQMNQQVSK